MKLFKSLLVAPATIGLLAPFSTFAGEANLNDISKYSNLEHLDLTNAFVNDEPNNNSLLAGGEGLAVKRHLHRICLHWIHSKVVSKRLREDSEVLHDFGIDLALDLRDFAANKRAVEEAPFCDDDANPTQNLRCVEEVFASYKRKSTALSGAPTGIKLLDNRRREVVVQIIVKEGREILAVERNGQLDKL